MAPRLGRGVWREGFRRAAGQVATFFFLLFFGSAGDFSARKLSEAPRQVTCDSDGTVPMMGNHNMEGGRGGVCSLKREEGGDESLVLTRCKNWETGS